MGALFSRGDEFFSDDEFTDSEEENSSISESSQEEVCAEDEENRIKINDNKNFIPHLITEDCLDGNDANNMTTDAAANVPLKSKTSTRAINDITVNDVLTVEMELDVFEKISTSYLVFENSQLALNECCELISNPQKYILTSWAENQELQRVKWQKKLVEAICIVQNYKALKKLGFQRRDLTLEFLPSHLFFVIAVNKWRKIIYFICEKLTRNERDQFLMFIMKDFKIKNFEFKHFNRAYLELYFLYWESIGYIKSGNLDIIYAKLKEMENVELCEVLREHVVNPKSPLSGTENTTKPVNSKTVDTYITSEGKKELINNKILDEQVDLSQLISMESNGNFMTSTASSINSQEDKQSYNSSFREPSCDRYLINSKNPGVCLIINQQHFYTEVQPEYKHLLPTIANRLDTREGSLKDANDLKATYDYYGFTTVVKQDLTHIEMVDVIEKVVKSVTEESSLFVCILSHGDEGIVYGINSCRVQVSDIQKIMRTVNYKNLKGKPKVLILQSCQGTKCQRVPDEDEDEVMTLDGPTSNQSVPVTADFLTFWATVPGHAAIRHKSTGSWFIQSLCKKMRELGRTNHFLDICTKIIREVSEKTWKQKTEEVAMVPLKVSTLTKDFYLPPPRNSA